MASDRGLVDPLLYQLMVEQSRDYALFILDKDGRVRSWNLGAQRLKGYAPEEIIGRHFSTFYTRDALDSEWPQYELKVAASEGRFEDEGWGSVFPRSRATCPSASCTRRRCARARSASAC
jgi:PAS domain-containing protein